MRPPMLPVVSRQNTTSTRGLGLLTGASAWAYTERSHIIGAKAPTANTTLRYLRIVILGCLLEKGEKQAKCMLPRHKGSVVCMHATIKTTRNGARIGALLKKRSCLASRGREMAKSRLSKWTTVDWIAVQPATGPQTWRDGRKVAFSARGGTSQQAAVF